jgi:hypothetical protein
MMRARISATAEKSSPKQGLENDQQIDIAGQFAGKHRALDIAAGKGRDRRGGGQNSMGERRT